MNKLEFDAWEVIGIIVAYMTLALLFLALKIIVIIKVIKSMIGGAIDGIKGTKVQEHDRSEKESDTNGFANS